MDATKREELEKAYRKEKDSRVILRMLAVHMVRVRKMSVSEAAANLMRSDRWVHTWLERFDAGGLDGLRDLPRSGRPPKIPREIMARIIEQAVQPQCTPRELQKIIREDTGTRLYITNVRKAMRRHCLTPRSRRRSTLTGPARRPSGAGSTASTSVFHAWRGTDLP